MHSIYLLNRQNPAETKGFNRADSVAAYLLGRRVGNYVIIVIKDNKPIIVDASHTIGQVNDVLAIQSTITAVLDA